MSKPEGYQTTLQGTNKGLLDFKTTKRQKRTRQEYVLHIPEVLKQGDVRGEPRQVIVVEVECGEVSELP